MLAHDRGAWTATCDACRATQPLIAATLEDAVTAGVQAGWMHQARKGVPLAKRRWLCPTCKPGDASGALGGSVGAGK